MSTLTDQSLNPSYLSALEQRALNQTVETADTARAARRKAAAAKSSLPTHPTIPNLFPRESVNLLAFTPKIGTFRFLLPQLANYAAGRPFLDIPHPCPEKPEQLGAILCNKQVGAVRAKIRSMGLEGELDEDSFPIVKWESARRRGQGGQEGGGQGSRGAEDPAANEFVLDHLYEDLVDKAGVEPAFVLVDSLYLLLESKERIGDPVAIGAFTDRLHEFCREHHCTVLGTIPTAKARPGDEYQILSHRIYGSVQWGVSTSCLMLIERYSDVSTYRRIRIEASLGRNEHETRWVDFDLQGRLMLRGQPEATRVVKGDRLREIVGVDYWEPEQKHSRAEILAAVRSELEGEDWKVSVTTVDRWLAKCVENKVLDKEGFTSKAQYWRRKPN